MKRTELPDQGLVFWPVGAGDSTTVLVNRDIIIQVDLNHLEAAKSDDDPRWPVVDELVECLPLVNGKRYLAAFVATHADKDHCQGFKELLEDHNVLIGELWFTPRLIADIDNEDPKELSEDARALRDEALRRVKRNAHREAAAGSGDRLRVIGYHDSLQGDFKALPASVVSPAGTTVQVVDGRDLGRLLRIFVHSPFKDYMEDSERNRTSIGLHVTLKSGGLRALLLGDLDYGPVKQVFEYTQNRSDKEWDVFLAPHHCSKGVMYERESGRDVLRRDVLDPIEDAKASTGWIVSSSGPIPASNSPGDNPPHAKAKARYEEICDTFLCTGEHPNERNPRPLIFKSSATGARFLGALPVVGTAAPAQVRGARGGDKPSSKPVGYGEC
ncbi:MAG: hypothetical protein OXM54_10705 [Acidimicrobiaceae bacterium]|nr:hypothetical protein [Acidimicrobiaceae bacterium]